jgi:hypothetical protein
MTTSLMPMDPALSPQQVTRLLPIRANLLPDEITNSRKARRMRTFVIVGVVLAVVALGGWSADAYHDRSVANDDLATVNTEVAKVNDTMHNTKNKEITEITADNLAISAELKTLMANDLRWPALLDAVRATAAKSNVTLGQISASLAEKGGISGTSSTTSSGATVVATLTLQGSGKDKKTIAGFIDALSALSHVAGISNPYLSTVSQGGQGVAQYSFQANADVTSVALCGRFTTPCKTGAK